MRTFSVFFILIAGLILGKIFHVYVILPMLNKIFNIPAGNIPTQGTFIDIVSVSLLLLAVGLFVLLIRGLIIYFDLIDYFIT